MLSLLFCFLLGVVDAARDIITFRYKHSIFNIFNSNFWDPQKSWKNKYKQPMQKAKNHWYYFNILKPKYEEAFPFSTYTFVFLTDAWHLLKALIIFLILLSVYYYKPIFNFPADLWLFFIAYSFSFNLFEDKIFDKTYWNQLKQSFLRE